MLALLVAAAVSLPAAEQAAIFTAAGFARRGAQWRSGCDDPSASYEPGAIVTYRDLNGDGRPEAIITEGGTYCYGHTGTGFWLLTKQLNGRWKVLHQSQGMAECCRRAASTRCRTSRSAAQASASPWPGGTARATSSIASNMKESPAACPDEA